MFAHNERISTRQFKRLLTLELFGVTTILLPGILCETVQEEGIAALLGGLVLVCIYGLLLRWIAKYSGRSLQQTLKKKSRLYYELFLFIMLIQLLLMGIWVLTLAAELSRDILLQSVDIRLVILTFAAVSIVGAWKGMECRGRMAEVLYLFLLLPFLALLFFAAKKVNLEYMPPILLERPKTIAYGSYEVFIVFQGVTLGFFALPYLKNQKEFWKGVRKSILMNGLFCILLLVVAIGIFGLKGAASQKWLAVNLMTTPELPGGIVERLDVFMVTIWIVALFFFVSGSIFYGGKMAGRLFNMDHEKVGLVIMAVLIVGGSIIMGNRDYAYYVYMNYMKYIGVPLLTVILLLILCRLQPKKVLGAAAGVLLILSLTGCVKGVELEDRDFVLALGVEYQEDKVEFYYDIAAKDSESGSGEGGQDAVKIETQNFYELQTAYGQQSDKYLDYNHLKVIIIGKNLASNQEKMIEFLQFIEKNELFARNVKIFLTEDLEGIFNMCSEMDDVLGEYLENLYIDSDYYVEEQSCSLGDLITHWHDYDETQLIPILEGVENRPMVAGYAVMRHVQWMDRLKEREADLIFLGNKVNIQSQFMVGGSYAVQLEHVSREINFTEENALQAEITIQLRGRIKNEEVESEKKKRELEKELNQQLEELYVEEAEDWKGWDVFHLFRAMGNYDRELWKKYRTNRQQFEQEITVKVFVETHIL